MPFKNSIFVHLQCTVWIKLVYKSVSLFFIPVLTGWPLFHATNCTKKVANVCNQSITHRHTHTQTHTSAATWRWSWSDVCVRTYYTLLSLPSVQSILSSGKPAQNWNQNTGEIERWRDRDMEVERVQAEERRLSAYCENWGEERGLLYWCAGSIGKEYIERIQGPFSCTPG
jgi:hypothetical protein